MSCAPACPTYAPGKPTCATRSKPSTPSSPTARPTSPWPPTWKASSPNCTPGPRAPPSPNAAGYSSYSSRTSSSDPKRSPSDTESRCADAPPKTPNPPPTPTRRVIILDIAQCVGGVLSPLLANIALTVLDEHLMGPWKPGGTMSTQMRRRTRMRKNLPNWRLVRYADDFVVLVRGQPDHVQELREQITAVLAPLGLRLSPGKTRVVDMREGFDFLGFRITWMRKRGTDKWFVYTFIADKPVRELKRKIRALTHRQSQVVLGAVLTRINQIQRGWANYFRHAVAKHTFDRLSAFVWWRIVTMVMHRHRMTWTALRRRFKGPQGWRPIVIDGIELFNISSVPVTRYRWRGTTIPSAWPTETIEPAA